MTRRIAIEKERRPRAVRMWMLYRHKKPTDMTAIAVGCPLAWRNLKGRGYAQYVAVRGTFTPDLPARKGKRTTKPRRKM